MRASYVFFLSNRLLRVYMQQQNAWQAVLDLPADTDGKQALATWLAQAQRLPTVVLTDLVEEDFHQDKTAYLRGRDKQQLLQRKLEQRFRGTPFRAFLPQGRVGKRDSLWLFSAIPSNEWIEGWLTTLFEARWPLIGLTSTPQLLHQVGMLTPQLARQRVVLLPTTLSGLRILYIDQNQLRLSRLLPLDEQDHQNLAPIVQQEAQRARQFLQSLRLLNRDEPLDMILVRPASELNALIVQLKDDENLRYHGLPAHQLDPQGASESSLEQILVALAAQSNNAYAPKAYLRYARLWTVNRVLKIGGAAAACILLVSALWLWQQERVLQAEIAVLQQKTRAAQDETETHRQALANYPVSPEDMQALSDHVRSTLKAWPRIQPSIQLLSQALAAYPDIGLGKISWSTSKEAPANAPAANTDNPDEAEATDAETPAGDINIPRYIKLELSGEVRPFHQDYRRVLGLLDGLRQKLMQTPGSRFEWNELPLDTRPEGEIDLMQPKTTAPWRAVWWLPLELKP